MEIEPLQLFSQHTVKLCTGEGQLYTKTQLDQAVSAHQHRACKKALHHNFGPSL